MKIKKRKRMAASVWAHLPAILYFGAKNEGFASDHQMSPQVEAIRRGATIGRNGADQLIVDRLNVRAK